MIIYSILIFIVLIVLAIFALFQIRKKLMSQKYIFETKWMSMGIGLGIILGLPLGLALGNIALGPALGVAMGVAIGSSLEKRYAKKLKLTPELRMKIWKTKLFLFSFLILGIIVFGVLFLINI